MGDERLIFERRGQVAWITLNRPDVLNAIDPPLGRALGAAIRELAADPDLRVGVLTGAGDRAFCAGADLKWRAAHPVEAAALPLGGGLPILGLDDLECWKPLIAAVNGVAVGGGCELALSCDLIVASETARFGLPEPTRGLLADAGGIHRLMRGVPQKRALELILTGRLFDAGEAHALGLVNAVVPPDRLPAVVERLVGQLLLCAPLAQQAAKQAAFQGLDWPLEVAIPRQYALHERMRRSEDFIEGPRAFAEKRPPIWTGRARRGEDA